MFVAIGLFSLGYAVPIVSAPCMIGFAYVLAILSSKGSARIAFYGGLLIGTSLAAIKLTFMASIFGAPAGVLWMILGVWSALFLLAESVTNRRAGRHSLWLVAVLWIGFEYFRSELYYLRFSWVTPGLALVGSPWERLLLGGQYLASGLLVLAGYGLYRAPKAGVAIACSLLLLTPAIPVSETPGQQEISIAGIQLEHPDDQTLINSLGRLREAAPLADILVLSEYTLDGPVPDAILQWCDDHDSYLIVGGKDELDYGNFYNTAFVVDPNGVIVHRQGKSVPIQFFIDGLPAPSQDVWDSPFGKVGLPICYDLSYTRVVDRYLTSGTNLIINPTMDSIGWGEAQHKLHSRIPRCRALEYRVPIFRLASSGISLAVSGGGKTLSYGAFPGQGDIVQATLSVPRTGHRSIASWLGPLCTTIAGMWISYLSARTLLNSRRVW